MMSESSFWPFSGSVKGVNIQNVLIDWLESEPISFIWMWNDRMCFQSHNQNDTGCWDRM